MSGIPPVSFENSCNGNNIKIEINCLANKSNIRDEQDQTVGRNEFSGIDKLLTKEGNGVRKKGSFPGTLNNGEEYESDTTMINNYNHPKKNLSVHSADFRPFGSSVHTKKKYASRNLKLKKQIGESTTVFPQTFNFKKESKIMYVYAIGSYFEGLYSSATDYMDDERNRFSSFFSYEGFGDNKLLAHCGFYHVHSVGPLLTRCFKCGAEYSTWSRDDDVLSVHRGMSPNCPFLLEIEQNDSRESTDRKQPYISSPASSSVSEAQKAKLTNLANSDLTPKSANRELPAEEERSQMTKQTSASITSSGLKQLSAANAPAEGPGLEPGIDHTNTVMVNNLKHPDYKNIDTRIGSYQGWPDNLDQTARQMAEAGFFFVGVADFTRCFCCGGGLRNWELGDDPMLEHTRWFPRCEYVNKLKGEKYVAAVQRRHQEHMAIQQQQQTERAQTQGQTRNPPDPMTTDAAAVLQEMGYSAERTREVILAVRQQTGSTELCAQQVLTWLLDDEERRLNDDTVKLATSIAQEIGYSAERTREAILAVRQQTVNGCAVQATDTLLSETVPSGSARVCEESRTVSFDVLEENRRLQEVLTCKICVEQPATVTFLPCGHLVCCKTCDVPLQICPVCRQVVMGRLYTSMS